METQVNLLISTPPFDVYEQMAFDEQMVRLRPTDLTLRFYRWAEGNAVTFGYAQFLKEVKQALLSEGFVGLKTRRPTGGGIVFHRDDLTFSLVFPSHQKPAEIYKNLHTFIFRALAENGHKSQVFSQHLPSSAYAPSVENQASACFVRPVENDLLTEDGHKILGGAIRRFGETILYQGSLQLPNARENAVYKKALISAVRSFFALDFRPMAAPVEWVEGARKLAQSQYQTAGWMEKF